MTQYEFKVYAFGRAAGATRVATFDTLADAVDFMVETVTHELEVDLSSYIEEVGEDGCEVESESDDIEGT